MRITETAIRRIIMEEMGLVVEDLSGTGPKATFRKIIEICEKALDNERLGQHPQVAKGAKEGIKSLIRMMDDVETTSD